MLALMIAPGAPAWEQHACTTGRDMLQRKLNLLLTLTLKITEATSLRPAAATRIMQLGLPQPDSDQSCDATASIVPKPLHMRCADAQNIVCESPIHLQYY